MTDGISCYCKLGKTCDVLPKYLEPFNALQDKFERNYFGLYDNILPEK